MMSKLTLKSKLILVFLLIGLLPFLIVAISTSTTASNALKKRSFEQLTAIRESKASQIEDYFEQIRNQILTLSENSMVVDAMKDFKTAFHNVEHETVGNSTEFLEMERSILNYYQNEYIPRLVEKTGNNFLPNQFLPNSKGPVILQSRYISNNPNAVGSKHQMNRSKEESAYNELHQQYHPIFRSFLEKFGYYDIFLVDPDTGHIIYSVFKEADYATSLLTGPYKSSGLAKAFKAVNNSSKDTIKLLDFAPYQPSYNAAASFIASPIFDNEKKVGVLIFQMPLDKINNIMTFGEKWELNGMGKSGETYIVGNDFKLRSQSRFFIEDQKGYIELMNSVGMDNKTQKLIKLQQSTIGLQSVETTGTHSAQRGNSNTEIFDDYRNVPVLSSYKPLNIIDVKWVLMSEIDEAEAFEASNNIIQLVLIVGSIFSILIIISALFFAKTVSRPIGGEPEEMEKIAKTIAEGDFTINTTNIDEATGLFFSMLKMNKNLSKVIKDVKENAHHLSGSSTELFAVSNQMSSAAVEMNAQAETISSASTQMSQNFENVAAAATQMSSNITSVAATATEMSQNMESVDSGVEEMANSIKEIAKESDNAVRVSIHAQKESHAASDVMANLGKSAHEIGDVTKLIKEIAQQTNLLALNANIEAASAGEAGRGFAVVANEIKELAKQSATAAEEISTKIEEIQTQTKGSVESIQNIAKVISEISSSSKNINQLTQEQSKSSLGVLGNVQENSKAVEEVAKMINEMASSSAEVASSISEMAKGTQEISKNITQIASASSQSAAGSTQVNGQAGELSKIAEHLNEMMQKFKISA